MFENDSSQVKLCDAQGPNFGQKEDTSHARSRISC